MSNRLRLVVAVLTLTLAFGGSIAFEQMLAAKTVEGTETHIHLAEHKMRTCGVETLRSSGKAIAITDDGMGGLIVSFSGTTHMTLHVVAISEDRIGIRSSWPASQASAHLRNSYENLSSQVAELLLQCSHK